MTQMTQQDFLRDLLELSADTSKANAVFEKYTEYKTYGEKLKFLKNLFPEIEVLHRLAGDTDNLEDDARNDYYAMLATIIDRKWR